MIVREWQRAKEVLEAAGFVVKVTEVLAIEVPDRAGGLADVLRVIDHAGVNVEYMYAFAEKLGDKAVLVFRFQDTEAGIKALADSQVTMLGSVELYSRLEGRIATVGRVRSATHHRSPPIDNPIVADGASRPRPTPSIGVCPIVGGESFRATYTAMNCPDGWQGFDSRPQGVNLKSQISNQERAASYCFSLCALASLREKGCGSDSR